jgi:hypothetical protein
MKKIDIVHIYLKHIFELEKKNNLWLVFYNDFNRDIERRINILQNAIVRVLNEREEGRI